MCASLLQQLLSGVADQSRAEQTRVHIHEVRKEASREGGKEGRREGRKEGKRKGEAGGQAGSERKGEGQNQDVGWRCSVS
jgi:predicted transposase YdaD